MVKSLLVIILSFIINLGKITTITRKMSNIFRAMILRNMTLANKKAKARMIVTTWLYIEKRFWNHSHQKEFLFLCPVMVKRTGWHKQTEIKNISISFRYSNLKFTLLFASLITRVVIQVPVAIILIRDKEKCRILFRANLA